jgi:hypothetical protein
MTDERDELAQALLEFRRHMTSSNTLASAIRAEVAKQLEARSASVAHRSALASDATDSEQCKAGYRLANGNIRRCQMRASHADHEHWAPLIVWTNLSTSHVPDVTAEGHGDTEKTSAPDGKPMPMRTEGRTLGPSAAGAGERTPNKRASESTDSHNPSVTAGETALSVAGVRAVPVHKPECASMRPPPAFSIPYQCDCGADNATQAVQAGIDAAISCDLPADITRHPHFGHVSHCPALSSRDVDQCICAKPAAERDKPTTVVAPPERITRHLCAHGQLTVEKRSDHVSTHDYVLAAKPDVVEEELAAARGSSVEWARRAREWRAEFEAAKSKLAAAEASLENERRRRR